VIFQESVLWWQGILQFFSAEQTSEQQSFVFFSAGQMSEHPRCYISKLLQRITPIMEMLMGTIILLDQTLLTLTSFGRTEFE